MELREGYKKTEMGVVPEDWEVINLAERSTLKARIGWQGLTTKEYLSFGDYYLVTGTDFIGNQIDWRYCCYVEKSRYEQDKNIQIKNGDLLVTKDGTIGKIAYVDNMNKPATLNSGVFVIRPVGGSYLPKYLFYVLSSLYFVNFLKQLAAGSTISHLYQKDFVKFRFLLPHIPEQQAIADALSDVDGLISSLTKLINKKKRIKQGAMQELLTGKKRLEGFSEKWVKKPLSELFDFSGGYSASRAQLSAEGYCYLHYGDIHGSNKQFIDVDNEYFGIPKLDIQLSKVTKEKMLQDGDIVFVDASEDVEGTSRHIVVINPNSIPYISGLHTIVAKNKKDILDNKFKRYCFQSDDVKKQFRFYAVGIKVSGLSRNTIAKIELYFPISKNEQNSIADMLSDMDSEIETLEKKLNKYKSIKQGMMQELLTGRIRLI